MRQPGATYPSDEARRKNKPAVRIHHSIIGHPRFAGAFADVELRGMWVGLMLLASIRHAGKTGNTVTLNQADICWISGRHRRDVALKSLRHLCDVWQYSLQLHGDVAQITIRNFARKQGFAPQSNGAYPSTPAPSESESESESKKEKKKHATHAPESPPEDSVSPEEIVDGWRSICVPRGLPDVRELSDKRRKKLRTRIKEHPTFAWWNGVFTKIQLLPSGSFFFGNGKSTWKGSLDWLIENEENALKVLEGNYDTTH